MPRVAILLSTFVLIAISSQAETYCAYEVHVKRPTGESFAQTPVSLVDRGKEVRTEFTDERGAARLCDAPLHPVDIVVGAVACGLTVIKGVRPAWPNTRTVVAVRDSDCYEFSSPDDCQVLLRIQDQRERPISGAQVSLESKGTVPPSDAFGRIFRKLKSGEAMDGTVVSRGHSPKRFSVRCSRGNQQDVELKLVLTPAAMP